MPVPYVSHASDVRVFLYPAPSDLGALNVVLAKDRNAYFATARYKPLLCALTRPAGEAIESAIAKWHHNGV